MENIFLSLKKFKRPKIIQKSKDNVQFKKKINWNNLVVIFFIFYLIYEGILQKRKKITKTKMIT